MSNLIVYTVLILIIAVLSIYYNELNKKKIILQEFFTNESINLINDDKINSVFSSLNALSKDYDNLQQKNQLLNNSLQQDHYNKYSKDLNKRYGDLKDKSETLGEAIRTNQRNLKIKADSIRAKHKPDYIANRRKEIIQQNTKSIQEQLNLDDVNKNKVK